MNYEISDQGISVTYGDEITQAPDNTSPEPGADGSINYYELLKIDDQKNILWRKKLGQSLGGFMVLKDYIDEISPEKAILKNFPPGYLLYEHRKQKPKGSMRTDTYLYGNHRFRSPNEFMPHLFWLASDKSEDCKCKYCRSSSRRPSEVTSLSSVKTKRQSRSDVANKEETAKEQAEEEASVEEGRRKKKGRYERVKKVDQPMDVEAERDGSGPSSRPKVKREPGESNSMIFRDGEIVWLDVRRIIDDDLLSKCNEINGTPIRYWPTIIIKVNSNVSGQVSESDTFTLNILMLHGQKEVSIDSIRPWIMCTPENTGSTNTRKTKASRVDVEDPNPEDIVRSYDKAVQKARDIAATYATTAPYVYRHSEDSPAELKKLENYPHFGTILFGPEILEEDDMVRLIPAHNEGSSDDDPTKRGSFLQITSIYQGSKREIKITGDAYDRGESVGENKYKWHPVNTDNEEFTVELSDIAGRFYPLWPDIAERITCVHAKKLQQRRAMYAEKSSETTPDLWLKMKHESSNRQIAKRKSSSASGTTRQYAKRGSPFKTPTETANKKRMIEVEQSETTTKLDITIDTSVAEDVKTPIKASVTPQVLSPDTPTFDSDEETKDIEALPQVAANGKEREERDQN